MGSIRDVKLTLSVKNNDPTVRDYNIYNHRVVPGLMLIDSIYNFLLSKGYAVNKTLTMKDILFKKPIVAIEGVLVKLQIQIRGTVKGFDVLAKSQRMDENGENASGWDDNFQCTIYLEENEREVKKEDMEQTMSDVKQVIDFERIYSLAKDSGITYKDFMLTKGKLYEKEDSFIANLSLGEIAGRYADSFYIHPAYIYGGLAMIYYFIDQRIKVKKAYVPVYIETLKFYKNLKNSCYIKMESEKFHFYKDETLVTDLEIYDDLGDLCIEAKGLSMNKIEEKSLEVHIKEKKEIIPVDYNKEYLEDYARKAKNIRMLIELDLKKIISTIIGISEGAISNREYFFKMGFDSKLLLEFAFRLDQRMGKKINPTILFGNPNVESLVGYIDKYLRDVYEKQFQALGKKEVEEKDREEIELDEKIGEDFSSVDDMDDEALIEELADDFEIEDDLDLEEGSVFEENIELEDLETEILEDLEESDFIEDDLLKEDIHEENHEMEDNSSDEEDLFDDLYEKEDVENLNTEDGLQGVNFLEDLDLDIEAKINLEDELDDQEIDKDFLNKVLKDIQIVISRVSQYSLEYVSLPDWMYSKELESDILMNFMNELNNKVDGRVSPTALFRYEYLNLLAEFIAKTHGKNYVFEPKSDLEDEVEEFEVQEIENREKDIEEVIELEEIERIDVLEYSQNSNQETDELTKALDEDNELYLEDFQDEIEGEDLEEEDFVDADLEGEDSIEDASSELELDDLDLETSTYVAQGKKEKDAIYEDNDPYSGMNSNNEDFIFEDQSELALDTDIGAYGIDHDKVLSFSYFISEISEVQQSSEEKMSYRSIKNLHWGQPIKQIDYVNVSTAFLEDEEGLQFFVYSDFDEENKNIHLMGSLSQDTGIRGYLVSVEDIRSRLENQEENAYTKLEKIGIKVGEMVRTIRSIDTAPKEILTLNRVEQTFESNAKARSMIIESIIQTLCISVDEDNLGEEFTVYPSFCKEISFKENFLSQEYYIYAKEVLRSTKQGIVRFSIKVIAHDGNIICRAKDFGMKIMRRKELTMNTRILENEGVIMGQMNKESGQNTENVLKESPIAIVGISAVLPKSTDVPGFFENITNKTSLITEMPNKRKALMYEEKEYNPKEDQEIFRGGYLEDIQNFDAKFFGIEDLEARFMDPQQRLLLQTVWNAVEDAGYRMSSLSKSKTGVFIGMSNSEYESIVTRHVKRMIPAMFFGLSKFYSANRISKIFNLKGPSEVVDTGFSSAFTSLKRATEEIHNGSCEVAIVGGSNLILSDERTKLLHNMGLISKKGECMPFDEKGDGFLRSEGIVVVVLKSLEKAQKNGDNIYGVIQGIQVGFAGDSSAPHLGKTQHQDEVILDVWKKSNTNPFNLDYFEMSSNGIPQEDKLELEIVKKAFGKLDKTLETKKAMGKGNIRAGSVKSFVGNMEAVSGLMSLIHVLMAMKYAKKPGVLNLKQINTGLDLKGSPLEIDEQSDDWVNTRDENGKWPKLAGINTMGIGGIFGHMVVSEYLHKTTEAIKVDYEHMFVFSAKNELVLKDYIKKFLEYLKRDGKNSSLEDVEYTLQIGREAMEERVVIVTKTLEGLEEKLKTYLEGTIDGESIFAGNINLNKTKFVPIFNGEEADAFVRLLMENKNYKNLAQLWILGIEFDWKQLHVGRMVKRTSLPGYPFRGQKYWFTEKNGNQPIPPKFSKDPELGNQK
jgi:3-oxoacyl-(acyl-carrier-protein) synthase